MRGASRERRRLGARPRPAVHNPHPYGPELEVAVRHPGGHHRVADEYDVPPGVHREHQVHRLVGEVHAVRDELHVRRPAGQRIQGGGDRARLAMVQGLHAVEQMGDQGSAQ